MTDGLIAALGGIIGAMITGGASIYVTRSARPVVYVPFHAGTGIAEPPRAPEPPAMGTEVEIEASLPATISTIQSRVSQGNVTVDLPNQTVVVKKKSTAFIIGLIGLIAWFIPAIGVPLACAGLWLAWKHSKMRDVYTHIDPAIWLNVMALTAAVINGILGILLAA